MSSADLKPLLFMEPLSETLKKLKEVMEENSESEGIEIFEVESLEEMVQLMPTIGQSVVLASSPKKCAMMLQQNRRSIKVLQSKIIMLSPKTIPRKTLDKFMKVGLTECVVEPVNPKTLMYKVRLQLRSIATKKESGELQKKYEEGQEANGSGANDKKAKGIEKGVIQDDDSGMEIKEKKKAEEVTMEDYSKVKKKDQQEEAIDNYYRGEKKQRHDEIPDEEEEKPKKAYQEEAIDTHYSGKLEQQEEIEEEKPDIDKLPQLGDLEEDEIEAMKKKMALEVEDDIGKQNKKDVEEFEDEAKSRPKSPSLEMEDDVPDGKTVEKDGEDLGGHYKGELQQGLDIEDDSQGDFVDKEEVEEEEIEAKKKKPQLDLMDDDAPKDYVDKEEEESEVEAKKKKPQLDLVDDERPDFVDKKEEEAGDEDDGSKDVKLEVEDEGEELSAKQEKLEVENDTEDERDESEVDHLDKYMRSPNAKRPELDVEDEKDFYDERESQEDEGKAKKEQINYLDIEEDNSKDPLKEEAQDEEDIYARDKKVGLSIEDDDDRNKEFEAEENEEGEFSKKKSSLNVEDDGGFGRKKVDATEKQEERRNRSNAKADHIKTHYSSKESIRHDEQDWESKWDKKQKEEKDPFTEKEEEKSLVFEKEDLGEQTIDYGKLQKEFDAINVDRLPSRKKKYGEFKESSQVKTYQKTVYDFEGKEVQMDFEEIEEVNEVPEESTVFEPDPIGMDVIVQVFNLYMRPKSKIEEVSSFIGKVIKERYSANTAFYTFDKSTGNYDSIFNSLIDIGAGAKPVEISDEEKKEFSRSELKLAEKHYAQEMEAYNAKKSELLKDWVVIEEEFKSEWDNCKLPLWSDKTFTQKEMYFVFPFFEGVNPMGYAVICFEEGFEEKYCKTIEMILESSRGLFLNDYHKKQGDQADYGKAKKTKNKKKESKGLFGKLMDKLAG